MDVLHKALITAGVVAGLLWLLRQSGPRAGGLAAALPLTSAPVLVWLGLEQGPGPVAGAASGALLSTALTPLLVAVYGRLSSRHGPLSCLLLGLGAAAVALLLLEPWLGRTALAGLAMALGLSALALRLLPRPTQALPRASHWRRELLQTAAVAGGLTWVIDGVTGHASATSCGLLAAFPVVGLTTLYSTHRHQGAAVACQFLAAYVEGTAAKAVFLALLVGGLNSLPLPWAWCGAAAGGLFTLLMLRHPRAQLLWAVATPSQ